MPQLFRLRRQPHATPPCLMRAGGPGNRAGSGGTTDGRLHALPRSRPIQGTSGSSVRRHRIDPHRTDHPPPPYDDDVLGTYKGACIEASRHPTALNKKRLGRRTSPSSSERGEGRLCPSSATVLN